ncbi:MAG: T9SS type A sorting domain-containing protein, partial [Bacteroidota bacterium]
VVTVTAISGNAVSFQPALTRDHKAPIQIQSQVEVHVANLTRNIVVSSENASVAAIGGGGYQKPRGHMMFMHTLDVQLYHMSTQNTGRTDKRIELDDWDATGLPRDPQPLPLIPDGYKNPRGKYSIHFHRGGTSPTLTPAHVEGCVVNNDPGWGFTNHSSRVDFVRNVSYDVVGAGFCTESGDETGSFIENFAARTYNPDEPMNVGRPTDPLGGRTEALADARENLSDFAWQGDGFWFHSTGVTVERNVVAGCTGHAFVYWSEGLIENNLGIARGDIDTHCPASEFPTENAELHAWKTTHPYWNYDIWYIWCRPFKDNTAYNMARGVHGYYVMTTFHEAVGFDDPDDQAEFNLAPPNYRAANKLVIENSTLWGMRRVGMGFTHCAQIELKNNTVYGYGTSTAIAPWTSPAGPYSAYMEVEPAVLGMDLDHYHNDRNWTLENNVVKGFDGQAVAVALPTNANTTVNGGTFDNGGVDFKIREVNWQKDWGDRVVSFDDNNMDPLHSDLPATWRNLTLQGNITFANGTKNIVLDPQMHMTNPAQDASGILDGDIKMSGFFLLPDEILLNFGPFNNAKLYFNHQHPDTIPATTTVKYPLGMAVGDLFPEQIIPDKYLNKTNAQLQTQYSSSFGGVLLPSTAVSHPMIHNGKVNASSVAVTEPEALQGIQLFPNPNPGRVHLDLQDLQRANVEVYTTFGQRVYAAQNLRPGVHSFDLNVKPGLYLVHVTHKEQRRTLKLVIQ